MSVVVASNPATGMDAMRSKKRVQGHAEQDLSDLFEMRAARLDLLRQRMHVAESPLERAAGKDRIDACALVSEVRDLDRGLDGVAAGKPHPGALGDVYRHGLAGLRGDDGQRVD